MPAEEKYEDLKKASYWTTEIAASDKEMEKFREQGKKVIDKFLDKNTSESLKDYRSLNLFHSNVVTMRAMLYGQTPKVDVSRRYDDATDDVARVACEMLERCLNNDIQFSDESFSETLRSSLDDFLLPGLGCAKIRYAPEFTTDPATGQEVLLSESAPVDYFHWKDVSWSAGARNWSEVRWVRFKTYVTKLEAEQQWGEEIASKLNYAEKKKRDDREEANSDQLYAEVSEIWCKKSKSVYWYSAGLENLVKVQPDPLKLLHFYPCPQPMMANLTTGSLVPKADFVFSQDLYNQIDVLTTRIAMLVKAIKVVGVYDKASTGVQRMLNEATENELIPVDNWAAFAEKGGLKGQIDWMPIEEIAKVLQQLEQQRSTNIELLYQTTGLSDILRGATDPRETKGAQELKSKFASIRIQALQDLFAKFASDLQKLKAEIIVKHFNPETIVKQSNMTFTPDAQLIPPAVQLLKQQGDIVWRIQIRPESIAMVDFAQLKQERSDYMMAISQYMQSAKPLMELDKSVTPFILEMMKWGLAGFKGSQQIEGIIDKTIGQVQQALSQPPPPPPPDPKVQAMQMKIQADQQAAQQEFQQKQMEFQQEMQQSQQKFALEMQQMREEFNLKMQELVMTMKTKQQIAVTDAEMNAQQRREEVIADATRTLVKTDAERQSHEMGLAADQESHRMGLEAVAAKTEAAKKQAALKPKPNGAEKR